ncbi:MAG: hypothetical protein AAF215_04275 [Cyanobacteria bacterium P01_A01_bin.123]
MMGHRLGRTAIGILLVVTLSACSLLGQNPPKEIIENAIALQLSQTQQALSQQLTPSAKATPRVEVSRVKVRQRQATQLNTYTVYRVTGTCDLQLTFPNRRVTETATPFEVYVQPGSAKATWLLAHPEAGAESDTTTWKTYPI